MDFDLQALIGTYGYLAVFIGSIFDGEAVLLLSGLLSHENYLSFPWIIFWAFLGAMTNDTWWFFLGRYKGEGILNSWSWFRKILGGPVSFMGKNPATLSFFMRFMYGFRQIVPFSIGMSTLPIRRFFFWNGLGTILWVTLFGGLGYALGSFLETFLGKLRHFELLLVIIVFLALFAVNLLVKIVKNFLNRVV